MTQATLLQELQNALRQQGRTDYEDCTLISAAATVKPIGKGALSKEAERSFKSWLLGPFFSRYVVSKGQTLEATQQFDCSKLARFCFNVPADEVGASHSHPLAEWMDTLRDCTGAHSLAPAPLIPWFVYSGTILHAISCCLVGTELYWHALASSLHSELTGPRRESYKDLIADPEQFQEVVDSLQPAGKVSAPGAEVAFHPLLLQAAANVLGRVIVLFDAFAQARPSWPPTSGHFVPWPEIASTADELEIGRQPAVCIAWESADRSRCVPLIPVRLDQESACFLPDHIVPPAVPWPSAVSRAAGGEGGWGRVKQRWLLLDRGRAKAILGGLKVKALSRGYVDGLTAAMSERFRQCTGLRVQTLTDMQGMLFALGLPPVPAGELVEDALEALAETRVLYSGVSGQLTPRPGLYRQADLVRGGRLFEAAVRAAAGRGEEEAAAEREAVIGREANGLRLCGLDVPRTMPPGKLRVHASAVRVVESAPETVYLVVRNTPPNSDASRTARVSKTLPTVGEEVALGIELPLQEEGVHRLQISLVPAAGPAGGTDAPVEVVVLSAGEHTVQVAAASQERRANVGAAGAADYTKSLQLKEEPTISFKFVGGEQLAPEGRIACRCSGDAGRMRPLDMSGQPLYQDGDCTLSPSVEGSCCDRKHWWGGKEYDNYPLEFNLHLICPTSYDPAGQTPYHVIWHEGESDPALNSNVFDLASQVIADFCADASPSFSALMRRWRRPDEPGCPWGGWEEQLNNVILKNIPDAKERSCPRRRFLQAYTGGIDLSH